MDWVTEKESQALQHMWPWFTAIFVIAFAIGLTTIKEWRRLFVGLKSEGGKIPSINNSEILTLGFIALVVVTWLLKLDLIFSFIGVIGMMLLLQDRQALQDLGWRFPLGSHFIWGFWMGLGTVFAFWIFHGAIFAGWLALGLPYEEQLPVKIFLETKTTSGIIGLAILACVIAPLLEELVFRGSLYPLLKSHCGGKIALLITSALFACVHLYWVGFLPLMMIGILLTLVYERIGSIWAAVGFHAAFNTLNFVQLFICKIGLDRFG
jgi:membrane protease YdiL (CAAX protease family)